LILFKLIEKNTLKASVKLAFCHTSENTVYSPFLYVVETVKKTRKPECCKGQNIIENM